MTVHHSDGLFAWVFSWEHHYVAFSVLYESEAYPASLFVDEIDERYFLSVHLLYNHLGIESQLFAMIIERFHQIVAEHRFVGCEVVCSLEHVVYPPVLSFVPVHIVCRIKARLHLVHEFLVVAAVVHDVVSPLLCKFLQNIDVYSIVGHCAVLVRLKLKRVGQHIHRCIRCVVDVDTGAQVDGAGIYNEVHASFCHFLSDGCHVHLWRDAYVATCVVELLHVWVIACRVEVLENLVRSVVQFACAEILPERKSIAVATTVSFWNLLVQFLHHLIVSRPSLCPDNRHNGLTSHRS